MTASKIKKSKNEKRNITKVKEENEKKGIIHIHDEK
jgi:hypothetical protein